MSKLKKLANLQIYICYTYNNKKREQLYELYFYILHY